jgi:hypothetical protein
MTAGIGILEGWIQWFTLSTICLLTD